MMNFENLSPKKNAVFDVICNCLPASINDCILVKHSLPPAAEALQGQEGARVLSYLLTTLFPEIIFLEKNPLLSHLFCAPSFTLLQKDSEEGLCD